METSKPTSDRQTGLRKRRIIIGLWVSSAWAAALDELVGRAHSDRAQLLRRAAKAKANHAADAKVKGFTDHSPGRKSKNPKSKIVNPNSKAPIPHPHMNHHPGTQTSEMPPSTTTTTNAPLTASAPTANRFRYDVMHPFGKSRSVGRVSAADRTTAETIVCAQFTGWRLLELVEEEKAGVRS